MLALAVKLFLTYVVLLILWHFFRAAFHFLVIFGTIVLGVYVWMNYGTKIKQTLAHSATAVLAAPPPPPPVLPRLAAPR